MYPQKMIEKVICITMLFIGFSQEAAISIPEALLDPTLCVGIYCPIKTAQCFLDPKCKEILDCLQVKYIL